MVPLGLLGRRQHLSRKGEVCLVPLGLRGGGSAFPETGEPEKCTARPLRLMSEPSQRVGRTWDKSVGGQVPPGGGGHQERAEREDCVPAGRGAK
jgi:hypothetical protein